MRWVFYYKAAAFLAKKPRYVQFNDYIERKGKQYVNITYKYRSDGTKVSKLYQYKDLIIANAFTTKITEYLDGFQYETESIGGRPAPPTPKFVPTAEGYYNFQNNKYIYSYTDHLGNVRLSYFKGSNGVEVLEENNYYPFGLKHEGYNPTAGNSSYQYKYNGKELQETGMYDYGARFYMPDIGRWGVVDPLAEKMTRHSPFNYAFNNSIRFIDPDGRKPETDFTLNIKTGEVKQVGETNNDPDRILKTDKNGDVVTNKKGEAKVAVDNIAKGILKDGQNFKTSDNVIDVGGKNQPTLSQAEDFITKMSEYVGTELGGAYLSKDAGEKGSISKVYLDKYKNNTYTSSRHSLYRCDTGHPSLNGYFKNTNFHTHPTGGFNRNSIENPSTADSDFKNNFKNDYWKFIILSRDTSGSVTQYPY